MNKESPDPQPAAENTASAPPQPADAAAGAQPVGAGDQATPSAPAGDTSPGGPTVAGAVSTAAAIPIVMRQPKGESVTIKVLVLGLKLFAKVMPIMLVGFIAYYSYTSYFGELPFIDNFKRKAAGMVGIKMAPPPAVKKKAAVTQMMDKAKDVVKANNRSVDFANALADDNVDMDKLTHLANAAESGMDINAAVTALAKAGEQAPAAEGEGGPQASPDPAAVNPAATGPTAEAKPKGKDPTGAVMGMLEEMSLVKVASEIEPMVKFRIWVGKANVSGVMDGASPKAYVNGYVYDKDEIIDEDLGISIEGVQGAGSILVFKDKTGALLGKLY